MLPVHVAQLAPALRPALLAAHKALQPGEVTPAAADTLWPSLQQLQRADHDLAAVLRDIGGVLANPLSTDTEVFETGARVESRMNGLVCAYHACQSLRASGGASSHELAEIARDTLVTYAHFLADLIFATADPAAAIQEFDAVQIGNTQVEINLTCSTRLPDSLDDLPHWVAGRLAYEDARCQRVLRLAEKPLVYRTLAPDLLPAPPPPKKSISFWEVLGWGAVLSLLFGHDHCDCGD